MFTRHSIFTTTEKRLAWFLLRGFQVSLDPRVYTCSYTHIYTYNDIYLFRRTDWRRIRSYIYTYLHVHYRLVRKATGISHWWLVSLLQVFLLNTNCIGNLQKLWKFMATVMYLEYFLLLFILIGMLFVSSSSLIYVSDQVYHVYIYIYTLYYTDQRHFPGTPGGNSLSLIPN